MRNEEFSPLSRRFAFRESGIILVFYNELSLNFMYMYSMLMTASQSHHSRLFGFQRTKRGICRNRNRYWFFFDRIDIFDNVDRVDVDSIDIIDIIDSIDIIK